jgi:hypothetical protein
LNVEEVTMKALVIGAAAVTLAAASPGWSQTDAQQPQTPSNEQMAPGAGGVSKPGVAGKPGSKSGPTVGPSSGTSAPQDNSSSKSGDESKVPGTPGNKSGATPRDPSKDYPSPDAK